MVGRDMTDIDRTEAQLHEAQKMEAVGRLTGGVAHDFNNILMVIMANVDELAEDDRLPPDLGKRITRIAQATHRASDLTHQLLAFARRQTLRPQWTDVNDLVSATTRLMRRALGETVKIDSRAGRRHVADRGRSRPAPVGVGQYLHQCPRRHARRAARC